MKNTCAEARTTKTLLLFANSSWYLWNFRLRLASSFQDHGWNVIFAAPPDDYSDRLGQVAQFVPLTLSRKGRNPFREAASLCHIMRMLMRERPDIAFTWTPKPNIYCGLASSFVGVRAIPNVSGLGFAFTESRWLSSIVGLLYKLAFRDCETVFFQNEEDRLLFVESNWVADGAASVLPGSGVDLDRFRLKPQRTGPSFVFLFAGRLLSDKGLRELVDAKRLLELEGMRLTVRVAGFFDNGNPAGIGEPEIRKWENDGIIEFLGATDRIEALIEDADCVVLPSYYREGIPRILLEAVACGRPVITSNTAGCRDVVEQGITGFLCEPRDVESLADAMRRLMKFSVKERETMGQAARKLAERKFSEDIIISAYVHEVSVDILS